MIRPRHGRSGTADRGLQLKRIVADKELELEALKEIAGGNW